VSTLTLAIASWTETRRSSPPAVAAREGVAARRVAAVTAAAAAEATRRAMVDACDSSWVDALARNESMLGQVSSGGRVGDQSWNVDEKP